MVSGEREIEMTALPIGNSPSIGKLKIAIQKLTDRRPDDLPFCGPQKFRASHPHIVQGYACDADVRQEGGCGALVAGDARKSARELHSIDLATSLSFLVLILVGTGHPGLNCDPAHAGICSCRQRQTLKNDFLSPNPHIVPAKY